MRTHGRGCVAVRRKPVAYVRIWKRLQQGNADPAATGSTHRDGPAPPEDRAGARPAQDGAGARPAHDRLGPRHSIPRNATPPGPRPPDPPGGGLLRRFDAVQELLIVDGVGEMGQPARRDRAPEPGHRRAPGISTPPPSPGGCRTTRLREGIPGRAAGRAPDCPRGIGGVHHDGRPTVAAPVPGVEVRLCTSVSGSPDSEKLRPPGELPTAPGASARSVPRRGARPADHEPPPREPAHASPALPPRSRTHPNPRRRPRPARQRTAPTAAPTVSARPPSSPPPRNVLHQDAPLTHARSGNEFGSTPANAAMTAASSAAKCAVSP